MCVFHETRKAASRSSMRHSFLFYSLAIVLGIISGILHIPLINQIAENIAHITIKIFKCLSLPLISLSLIATITGYSHHLNMRYLSKRVLTYTLGTTLTAACIACILYVIIQPGLRVKPIGAQQVLESTSYFKHLSNLVPSHLIEPYLEHNVLAVLLLSIIFGLSIQALPNPIQREALSTFFQGLNSVFMLLAKYVTYIIPLALYGFICVAFMEFQKGESLAGIGTYLAVVLLANMIQGLIVLPLWLLAKGINPLVTMRGMLPALSLAFFSKSSAASLPITIECAENRLNIKPQVARFVLPLCTSINMNGCAAFIFTSVIFVLQSHGVPLTPALMLLWICIATLAAIGNAGVPMGCFFLSTSLLSSMNVPLTLMGVILPFYSLIDMVETTLNVWSDACVTQVIDKSVVETQESI